MIPPDSKTLMLLTPVDMFQKLFWEYVQLQEKLQTDDPRVYGYKVLNGAITALHMRDWICEAFTAKHYTKLMEAGFPIEDRRTLIEFAMANTSFRLCESVANAAKHYRLKPRVQDVSTSAKRLGGEGTGVDEFWVPTVADGESSMPLHFAIGEIIRMWEKILVASEFAERDELFQNIP